jgi:hypothetical protein
MFLQFPGTIPGTIPGNVPIVPRNNSQELFLGIVPGNYGNIPRNCSWESSRELFQKLFQKLFLGTVGTFPGTVLGSCIPRNSSWELYSHFLGTSGNLIPRNYLGIVIGNVPGSVPGMFLE